MDVIRVSHHSLTAQSNTSSQSCSSSSWSTPRIQSACVRSVVHQADQLLQMNAIDVANAEIAEMMAPFAAEQQRQQQLSQVARSSG